MKREIYEKEMYEHVLSFPSLMKESYGIEVLRMRKGFDKIVIVGMGGSYIAGLVVKELVDGLKIPIEVCNFPTRIGKKDLLILMSYSGNSKEILMAFEKFIDREIIVISSGGKLLNLAKKYKKNKIVLRGNLHQRFTLCYQIFPLLKLFERMGLIKSNKGFLERMVKLMNKNQKVLDNRAKIVAKRIGNRVPLVYYSESFFGSAYRLQTSFEEDAKIISHSSKIPELFHNEIEGLPNKEFFPILMMDNRDISFLKKEVSFFKRLLGNYYEFKFYNLKKEERIILGLWFADFCGYYLAQLNKTKMGETLVSDRVKRL